MSDAPKEKEKKKKKKAKKEGKEKAAEKKAVKKTDEEVAEKGGDKKADKDSGEVKENVVEQKKPDTEKPQVEEESSEVKEEPKGETNEEEQKTELTTQQSGAEPEKDSEKEEEHGKKPETEDEENDTKKPRRFKLPFMNRGKKDKDKDKEEKTEEPLSARQAINAIDAGNPIKTEIKIEQVAKEIDEAVEEMEHGHEYLVIKVRKKLLLIVVGVAVLTMWMIPLSRGAAVYFEDEINAVLDRVNQWTQRDEVEEEVVEEEKASETEEASQSAGLRVRVLSGTEDADGANALAEMLKGLENVDLVELVDDEENSYDEIEIVTEEEGDETYQAIYDLLDDSYEIASNGATLEDTGVDVVIKYGE